MPEKSQPFFLKKNVQRSRHDRQGWRSNKAIGQKDKQPANKLTNRFLNGVTEELSTEQLTGNTPLSPPPGGNYWLQSEPKNQ